MAKKYVLPDMEKEIHIEVVGKESKINWAGDFKYRRPAIGTRGRIDVSRAKLNQDQTSIDPDTNALHIALSHLMHTLIEYPDWWKEADFGANLYDHNVVLEIYEKCMDFEEEWHEKVHGGSPEDVEVDDAPHKKNNRSK